MDPRGRALVIWARSVEYFFCSIAATSGRRQAQVRCSSPKQRKVMEWWERRGVRDDHEIVKRPVEALCTSDAQLTADERTFDELSRQANMHAVTARKSPSSSSSSSLYIFCKPPQPPLRPSPFPPPHAKQRPIPPDIDHFGIILRSF